MVSHPNLKVWLPLDAGLADYSGNGSFVNTAGSTTAVSARMGQGRDFNGTSNYMYISDSSVVEILGAQTIVVTVKPDRVNATQTIVAKGSVGNWSFVLQHTSNNELLFHIYGNLAGSIRLGRKTSTGALSVGVTAHLIFEYDGGTSSSGLKIFRDLVQIDTVDDNAGTFVSRQDGNADLRFAQDNGVRYFDGVFDDIQVYNKIFSMPDKRRIFMGLHPIT